MQGTGTQTDPFFPTNWSEFITAIETAGAYVECPENAVWNMNEILPNGIKSKIKWGAAVVKGNDLTITDLRFDGGYFEFDISGALNREFDISKLNFLNLTNPSVNNMGAFYLPGPSSGNGHSAYFRSCKFSGLISSCVFYKTNLAYIWLTSDNDKGCSVSFTYSGGGYIGNAQYENCNIYINGTTTASMSQITASEMKNCYISGKLPYKGNFLIGGTDCIWDIEVPDNVKIATSSASNIVRTLINTDKVHGTISTSNTGTLIKVTEAQLSDAEYLQSQGFSIVVGE